MLQGSWTLPPITPDTKKVLALCLIIEMMSMKQEDDNEEVVGLTRWE